eukprot:5189035-Heterocapsa_arctica.AAC.1
MKQRPVRMSGGLKAVVGVAPSWAVAHASHLRHAASLPRRESAYLLKGFSTKSLRACFMLSGTRRCRLLAPAARQ